MSSRIDYSFAVTVALLFGLGLVMVVSASVGYAQRLEYSTIVDIATRQQQYFGLALVMMLFCALMPSQLWFRLSGWTLWLGVLLLVVVFIPNVGVNLNNARRWIGTGGVTLQVSEVSRLAILIYLASYMARHGERVRSSLWGFLTPMAVVLLAAFLLLLEPDMGAAAVLVATCMGLLFLAGAKLRHFGATILLVGALAVLAIGFANYRQQRLIFINPWQDASGGGYQLIQSLMAFASGGFNGVGLGASVQKLGYLPEAHNDFVFAILAEELGFVGVAFALCLYLVLIWRVFAIGAKALAREQQFGAFLCFGIGVWLACQVLINIGVTMGLLPTKGLVLPFMSSGGSAVVMTGAAMGMIWRIHTEATSPIENQKISQKNKLVGGIR